MVFKDIRSYISFLEERKCVTHINKIVDPVFEVAKITKRYDGESAVLFEKIKDNKPKIITNLFTKREWFKWLLQMKKGEPIIDTIIRAANNPIPSKMVSKGPVKEVSLDDINLLKTLPIPTHYRLDGGPYITSGVIIAKDPDSGARNASYARMQVAGRDKLRVMINNWRHLWTVYRKFEQEKKSLPVAIVIGGPPSFILQGGMPWPLVPLEVDELDVAGALTNEPLELIKCNTINLEVPANSEIVLEGEMPPIIREEEGPFADYAFVYDALLKKRLTPIIKIKAITHRKDPLYYDILPAGMDHLLIGGLPREAEIYDSIKKTNIDVQQVHLTEGSKCRFHVIIQIKKSSEVDGKNTIMAAFYPTESARDLKLVVVVDEDIDPFDLKDVEWALATRVQYNKDILVIEGSAGALDPSAIISTPEKILQPPSELGVKPTIISSKMGIDATKSFANPDLMGIYQKPNIPDKGSEENEKSGG
jgi:2,5-furandicarboxylate decarboxylase 1